MQAQVLALAIKTGQGAAMQEVQEAVGDVGGGLQCPVQPSPNRGITFLSSSQWSEVNAELETELPWHTRRANVLLDCGNLMDLIGKEIQVGELRVQLKGETVPCATMDAAHKGLTRVLVPECRGGVFGKIVQGGTIRVGDTFQLLG